MEVQIGTVNTQIGSWNNKMNGLRFNTRRNSLILLFVLGFSFAKVASTKSALFHRVSLTKASVILIENVFFLFEKGLFPTRFWSLIMLMLKIAWISMSPIEPWFFRDCKVMFMARRFLFLQSLWWRRTRWSNFQILNSHVFRCLGSSHLARNCTMPFRCKAYFGYGHNAKQCLAWWKFACHKWIVKENLVEKEYNKSQSPPSLPPSSRPLLFVPKTPNPISPSNLLKFSSMANININLGRFLDVGQHVYDGSPNHLFHNDLMIPTPQR